MKMEVFRKQIKHFFFGASTPDAPKQSGFRLRPKFILYVLAIVSLVYLTCCSAPAQTTGANANIIMEFSEWQNIYSEENIVYTTKELPVYVSPDCVGTAEGCFDGHTLRIVKTNLQSADGVTGGAYYLLSENRVYLAQTISAYETPGDRDSKITEVIFREFFLVDGTVFIYNSQYDEIAEYKGDDQPFAACTAALSQFSANKQDIPENLIPKI